jgi:hypothetical protein
MRIVNRLRSIICRTENPVTKPDVSRSKLAGEDIESAVNEFMDTHSASGSRAPLDGEYYAVSREEMREISKWNYTNREEYESAQFDCENFAISFMADVQRQFGVTTVGLVIDWSGGHAYNLFVYEDGTVELFEPQNDRFVDPGEAENYSFDHVQITI